MIRITGSTMSDIYPQALRSVLEAGEEVAPRGMKTVEISPAVIELTDPRECLVLQKARRLNYAFAIMERLFLLTGRSDADALCFYVERLRDYVNEEGCFDGAYGPRVRPQLRYIYDLLRTDPDTRRAVINIYSMDDQRDSADVPCTLSLQFLIRAGKLDLLVNMRSSDLFLGLPYDVSQFAFLQQVVAGWLGTSVGRYIHWAASAHIYQSDRERVDAVIQTPTDLLDVALPVPRLRWSESFEQAEALLNYEHAVRHSRHDWKNRESLLQYLALEYQEYATILADYVAKRLKCNAGPSGALVK